MCVISFVLHSKLEQELATQKKCTEDIQKKLTTEVNRLHGQVQELQETLGTECSRAKLLVEEKARAEEKLQRFEECGMVS